MYTQSSSYMGYFDKLTYVTYISLCNKAPLFMNIKNTKHFNLYLRECAEQTWSEKE